MANTIWLFPLLFTIQCLQHRATTTSLPGGTYTAITTLRSTESPYYLQDDMIIASTASLIIENNVELYMNSHKIEVKGLIISGCSTLDTTTSSTTLRGVDATNFIYIYGGHSIKLLSDGSGEFCNTKFESMAIAIVDDSDNSNSYVDNCHFHDIPYALQLGGNNYEHRVTDSVFTNIHKSISEEGNVQFDNCEFDTFEKLFDSTPTNIVMINNEIRNAKYTCIELYACADCLIANNLIANCPTAIKVKSNGNAVQRINNNTISNCGRYAIETYHRNTEIVGNRFVSNVNAIFADENILNVVNNTFEWNTHSAIKVQFDVDNDGVIDGNMFVHNGATDSCTNLIEVVEGGRKLTIKRNTFRNNSCQSSLLALNDNRYLIIEGNAFTDNRLLSATSSATANNLISVFVSQTITSRTNTTVSNNEFDGNVRLDNVLYVEGSHVLKVTKNQFASSPARSCVYINNAKTNELQVSSNNFTSLANVQNYHIYLQSTSYDVSASDNYFGEIESIQEIAAKLYDKCNDAKLGQIAFCPWTANSINIPSSLAPCNCNSLDLCTATTCSADNEPLTTDALSPSSTNNNIPSSILIKTPTVSPTARPTIPSTFKGALFVITFGDNIHHNHTHLLLQRILLNIINNTVTADCISELTFTAQTATSFDGMLSVCDESSERKLRFLFESADGLNQLETAITSHLNAHPEIVVYIEDAILSNGPPIKTTPGFIFVRESSAKITIRDHLMYFMIVSAVLVISCFIGIVQYCRYEGRQSSVKSERKQKAFIRDRDPSRPNKELFQRMPVANHSRSAPSEPGSSVQRLNTNPSLQFSDIHNPRHSHHEHDGYYYNDSPPQVELELAGKGEQVRIGNGLGNQTPQRYRYYSNQAAAALPCTYPTQQQPRQSGLFRRTAFDDFDDDDDHSGDSEQLYVKVSGQGTLNAPPAVSMGNTAFMECESSSDDHHDHDALQGDHDAEHSMERRLDTLRTDTTNEDGSGHSDELQCVHVVRPTDLYSDDHEVDLTMANATSLDTNGQSPVIEGDDRAITSNLDLARPQTIR